jgi:hypothetical protein
MRDQSGQMLTAQQVIANNLNYEVPVVPDWDLLKTRMEMKYHDGKLETIVIMDSVWTPEDQINEIRKTPMTRYGRNFLLAEQGFLEYICYG